MEGRSASQVRKLLHLKKSYLNGRVWPSFYHSFSQNSLSVQGITGRNQEEQKKRPMSLPQFKDQATKFLRKRPQKSIEPTEPCVISKCKLGKCTQVLGKYDTWEISLLNMLYWFNSVLDSFSICFLTSERNLASNCNYLKQGARYTHYSFPTGKSCYWTLVGNKSTWWVYKRDRINKTWVREDFKHMRQQVSWSEYHLNTRDTLIIENIFYLNKKKL